RSRVHTLSPALGMEGGFGALDIFAQRRLYVLRLDERHADDRDAGAKLEGAHALLDAKRADADRQPHALYDGRKVGKWIALWHLPSLIGAPMHVDRVHAHLCHLFGAARHSGASVEVGDEGHAGILSGAHGLADAGVAGDRADGRDPPALIGRLDHVLAHAIHHLVV